jgi:hypothetical protein
MHDAVIALEDRERSFARKDGTGNNEDCGREATNGDATDIRPLAQTRTPQNLIG